MGVGGGVYRGTSFRGFAPGRASQSLPLSPPREMSIPVLFCSYITPRAVSFSLLGPSARPRVLISVHADMIVMGWDMAPTRHKEKK